MSDVEPYGVMPQSEISDLRKQMKKLQEGDSLDSNQLLQSMNNLTKGMDSMLQLFKTAAEEMKLEEIEEKALSREVQPMMDRLNEIIEQNKVIAEGMIALADLVKEKALSKENDDEEAPDNAITPPDQGILPPNPGIFPPPNQMRPPQPGQPPSMYMGQPNMNIPPAPRVPPMPQGGYFPSPEDQRIDLPPPPAPIRPPQGTLPPFPSIPPKKRGFFKK